jgi:hypothetical protein
VVDVCLFHACGANAGLLVCTALGNGGKTDKYTWTQQLADLSVVVPVPPGTKTKMLDIKITNNRLKVMAFP